jgi:hypothetical protein
VIQQPSTATMSSDQQTQTSPTYTYHCLCSQLVLASSKPITSHSQRAGESADKAYCVRVADTNKLLDDDDDDDDNDNGNDKPNSDETASSSSTAKKPSAVLINVLHQRQPLMLRRSDGFEKRFHRRCVRCNLVIGYHLDAAQYDSSQPAGIRADVVYILPDALTLSDDLMKDQR